LGFALYKSSNNGVNWDSVSSVSAYTLVSNGNNLYSCDYTGIFFSTNNGINWNNIGLQYADLILINGTNIFAGCSGNTAYNGVYLSTNNGLNWFKKNQGFFQNAYANALFIKDNYIFAAIGITIWRRSLTEIVGINPISENNPSKYTLRQNYPNSFNPNTIINFQIKESEFVKLKVYDASGKEVGTLVNEKKSAGKYEIIFNGSQYPSGVYFYKINAGNYYDVKKMILLK